MRKRIAGVIGCFLALTVAAQAQTVPEKKIVAIQMQFTQDGKELMATVFQKSNTTGAMSQWHLMKWDVENGRELSRVRLPGLPFLRYLFSPDGRLFYRPPMKEEGEKVVLCNAVTGKQICALETPHLRVNPQVFSADGKLLAARSNLIDKALVPYPENVRQINAIGFWDTRTGKQVSLFENQGESERFSDALFSADNRTVVCVGTNVDQAGNPGAWVVVFNRHTGQRLNSFSIDWQNLRNYALSPNGRYLASLNLGGRLPQQIALWDTQTGKPMTSLTTGAGAARFRELHFSADSSQLTAFGASQPNTSFSKQTFTPHDYWKQTWSVASGQKLHNARLPVDAIYLRNTLRLTLSESAANDRLFARATNENKIQLYEQESGKLIWEIELGAS